MRRCCVNFVCTVRRGAALAALVLALAGCQGQTTIIATDVPSQSESWRFGDADGRRVSTEHYEIYTTLTEPVLLAALPQFVEGCYQHYRSLAPPAREPRERMRVYLFASRPQWELFTRRFAGPRAVVFLKVRNGGYSDRGVSVIEYVSHDVTFPLFAHEGFHQYLHHHVDVDVPAWLNEGLAVECEGQRWGKDGLKSFDAWYNPLRRNALSTALVANQLHPLRTLLNTHAGKVIDGSTSSVATYYAQLWGLVLFLREGAGRAYSPRFAAMLEALGDPGLDDLVRGAKHAGDPPAGRGEALFRAFIDQDLDVVEDEYFEFLRQRFLGVASRP